MYEMNIAGSLMMLIGVCMACFPCLKQDYFKGENWLKGIGLSLVILGTLGICVARVFYTGCL